MTGSARPWRGPSLGFKFKYQAGDLPAWIEVGEQEKMKLWKVKKKKTGIALLRDLRAGEGRAKEKMKLLKVGNWETVCRLLALTSDPSLLI